MIRIDRTRTPADRARQRPRGSAFVLKGFKMSVRLALRLLKDSRARKYQVEPGFATAVLTVLGSVLSRHDWW